nr:endoribonuclease Dicer-like [Leptinotarsa decemlineata]
MSEDFTPRNYQIELMEIGLKKNTIMFLPTGSGKTFISLLVLKNMSRSLLRSYANGGKVSIILVNTVALVDQHQKYILNRTNLTVGQYTGEMNLDNWPKYKWQAEFDKYQVLIMTSQILVNLFNNNFIDLNKVNLLIFDECHRAVNDHSMRQLMKFFENLTDPPRVIGLTATLLNGSCKPHKVVEKVLALETTFHSKVATVDGLAAVVGYSTNPSEHLKVCDAHILEPHERIATNFLKKTETVLNFLRVDDSTKAKPLDLKGLQPLSTSAGRKDLSNMLQDLAKHIETMGSYGGLKATVSCLIQVERMKQHCEEINFFRVLMYVQTCLSYVKETLSNAMVEFEERQKIFKFSSEKMLALLDILDEYKRKSEEKLCAIVFTARRSTAKVIYHVLQALAECHEGYKELKPEYIVGCNNNPLNDTRENLYGAKRNKRVLQAFTDKEINVLVASNVLEEGVDIPKCTLVIKYDRPEDYRSYIQSKGRARHRKSLYYIMVEVENLRNFEGKYAEFQKVEKLLNEYLIGKNQERSDPSRENIEKMYNEAELPPYFVNGLDSAQVNMTSAIPLLCQYCNSLPSDMYTCHTPEWYVKKNIGGVEADDRCSVVIMLPTACPEPELLKPIEGPFMKSVKVAKRAAALKACEALHKAGELDDHLQPIKRRAKEEDVKFLFTHYPAERERGAGSAKRRRLHKRHITTYNRGQLKENSTCYLHVINFEPLFQRPTDPNDSAIYDLYCSNLQYGILTPSPLPVLCDFPLYTPLGEMKTSLRVNQKKLTFTREEIVQLRKFQALVFGDILKTLHPFVVFDNGEEVSTLIVVPLEKGSKLAENLLWNAAVKKVVEPTEEEKLELATTHDEFVGKIVSPWYRDSAYYLVTEVRSDENSLSPFPSENYSTFKDYFEKHRELRISHPEAPLLTVRGLTGRMNFLKPRGHEGKRKREQLHEGSTERLLTELVVRQDFPAALWIQASLLPSVIFRIDSLLQAEELRCTIIKEAFIGDLAHNNAVLQADKNLRDYRAFAYDEEEHPDVALADNVVSGAPETKTHFNRDRSMKTLEEMYPWKDSDEPKDVEKDLSATISDVERFEAFVGTRVRNDDRVNQEKPLQQKEMRLQRKRIEEFSHPPIRLLEASSGRSPDLAEVYKALTTAHVNDFVNLERLETLGDSFLKLTASVYISQRFPLYDEGRATDLKGRLVSNKNLYYLALRKGLNGLIRYNELAPKGNWVPPGFSVPQEIRKRIQCRQVSIDVLDGLRFSREEQVTGVLTESSLRNILNEDSSAENDEDRYASLGPLLGSQYVGDKYVADVVEALLGACFSCAGFRGGIKFMEWMGIIPLSENFENFLKQAPQDPVLKKDTSSEDIDYHIPHWREIEEILGYNFRNRAYLLQALTHASYTPNRITRSYEKLEFLGDAVLDFLITCYIYESCGNLNPGQMTDLRSALVNNNTFASLVVRNGLHKFLLMISSKLQGLIDKFVSLMEKKDYEVDDEILILLEDEEYRLGETVDVPKVLGDIFEAIAGAIYLDCDKDLGIVWKVFYKLMHKEITEFSQNVPMNVIRRLFEWDKAHPRFGLVQYMSSRKSMIPLRVMLNGTPKTVYGVGANKSMAKKAAAKMALRFLSS